MIRITFIINLNNGLRVTLYTGLAMMISLLQFQLASVIDRHEQSARQLRMANGSNLTSDFHCNIPYDDFRCTPIRTKDCLHSHEFKVARILPLIFFVIEISIVFSISGSYKSFFVYVLWTIYLYTLVTISIVVIKKSCYYESVNHYLGFTAFAFVIVIARIVIIDTLLAR
jgi:hypothetical protein